MVNNAKTAASNSFLGLGHHFALELKSNEYLSMLRGQKGDQMHCGITGTTRTSRSVTSARRAMGICVIHSFANGLSASDCTGKHIFDSLQNERHLVVRWSSGCDLSSYHQGKGDHIADKGGQSGPRASPWQEGSPTLGNSHKVHLWGGFLITESAVQESASKSCSLSVSSE